MFEKIARSGIFRAFLVLAAVALVPACYDDDDGSVVLQPPVTPGSNTPPVADDQAIATSVNTPISTTLTGSDADGHSITFALVGGPSNGTLSGFDTASGAVTYTPNPGFGGSDLFTFTAHDGLASSIPGVVTITVTGTGTAPVAMDDSYTVTEDSNNNNLAVLSNDYDPDSDPLDIIGLDPAANGTVSIQANSIRYTPNPDFFGVDAFVYTVGDGNGNSDTATVTVTVTPINDDPIAVDDAVPPPAIVRSATPVAVDLDVLANDSDPDGDSLTITSVGASGATAQGGTVTTDGSSVSYTPPADFSGVDTFPYTISDGNGGTAAATVTVTIDGLETPVATDDSTTIAEDTVLDDFDVLANDTGLGDTPITVVITTLPANGTAIVNLDNTIDYTPNADYNGTDTFQYTVTDSDGDTAMATVTITITPDAPATDGVTSNDDDAFTVIGGAVTFDVLFNDLIPDGVGGMSVPNSVVPAKGDIAAGAGPSYLVTYTHTDGTTGADASDYQASDTDAQTDTADIDIFVLRAVDTRNETLNPNDNFGYSIVPLGWSLSNSSGPSGEWVVGAPGRGPEGEVLVIDGDDGSVLTRIYPGGDSHNSSAQFGSAVAVYGSWIWIGAPEWSANSTSRKNCGAVFRVSLGNPASSVYVASLIHAANSKDYRLGASLVRVGGYMAVSETGLERVRVYNASSLVLSYINNPNGDVDNFGAALSVGDTDDDAILELLIGAPGFDNLGLTNTGAVYSYEGLGGTLTWNRAVNPDPSGNDDAFGASLAAGDLENDGSADEVIVGAPGAQLGAGRIYILDLDGATTTTVENPKPTGSDEFGSSVAVWEISGDVRILAGAPMAMVGADADAGVVFSLNPDGTYRGAFENPASAGDEFGHAIYADAFGALGIGVPLDDVAVGVVTVGDGGSVYFLPYSPVP